MNEDKMGKEKNQNKQSLILENAIIALRIGLEDYEHSKVDPDRMLSSIRNVYAGLLLFLKEGLCRLSPPDDPELLIKDNIVPVLENNKSVKFVGKGRKTVDVQKIQERYKSLGVKINWGPLDVIQEARNNIEHYYSTQQIVMLQGIIVDASAFLIDISKNVLSSDPVSLLGPVWDQILTVKGVYEPIKSDCNKSLAILQEKKLLYDRSFSLLKEFTCSKCRSELLYLYTEGQEPNTEISIELNDPNKIRLMCFACHLEITLPEAFEQYAVENFELSYNDFRNGAEAIVKECPECGHQTFIDDHFEDSCIFCGYAKSNTVCRACGEPLSLEEDWEGLCFSCSYRLSEP